MRALHWTNVGATIGPFTGATAAELQVPCTFDFDVGATKYFYGLEDGEIPLCLLFSGTVFHGDEHGAPRIAPIPWSKEAQFRLPVEVWRRLMELYYPNCAWLRLRRDVFDRLYQFKIRHGIPTWEAALERVLAACEETVTQ